MSKGSFKCKRDKNYKVMSVLKPLRNKVIFLNHITQMSEASFKHKRDKNYKVMICIPHYIKFSQHVNFVL